MTKLSALILGIALTATWAEPHHGSYNGSLSQFIKAVASAYVVFSAGHSHGHLKKSVVD